MPEAGTVSASPEARLKELGLVLEPVPKPLASYTPWVRTGNLVFVSGQVPLKDGKPLHAGHVGREVTVAQAQECGRLCVVKVLSVLKEALGSLDKVQRIVRVVAYTAAAPGFTEAHVVANGASDLLVQVFGDRGKHTRVAVGVAELPLNVPFELDVLAEVR